MDKKYAFKCGNIFRQILIDKSINASAKLCIYVIYFSQKSYFSAYSGKNPFTAQCAVFIYRNVSGCGLDKSQPNLHWGEAGAR